MKLDELDRAVREHAGEFLCEEIADPTRTKVVEFTHVITPPDSAEQVPEVGRLRDFYDTFGSLVLYSDEKSGDAAKYIAPPDEWAELDGEFREWIDMVDADEEDMLPAWVDTCLVIGEIPESGNYIIMATEGPEAGQVFEFDHDGFEFTEEAPDIVAYVETMLQPDNVQLVVIASYLRFTEDGSNDQWWIRSFKDNRGHTASTEA